jgi:uncharacterized protein YndB with AHSA1/START domain
VNIRDKDPRGGGRWPHRDVRLERVYLHPPELVWRALTDREVLAEWLMPNDFAPVVGHTFTMRTDPGPGFDWPRVTEGLRWHGRYFPEGLRGPR